jgi:transcription antitermination factor NusG
LTGARGFVEPLPLTPQEIDQFQLEAKKYGLDSVPDPTLGFTIGDMVEIVEGAYKGERGPIRLVRNGGVTVRLFAYGQWFDLDFKPKVRRDRFRISDWKKVI